MSMSDCEKCWDTPCTCGWGYRNWSREYRIKQASLILGISNPDIISLFIGMYVPEIHPQNEEVNKEVK